MARMRNSMLVYFAKKFFHFKSLGLGFDGEKILKKGKRLCL